MVFSSHMFSFLLPPRPGRYEPIGLIQARDATVVNWTPDIARGVRPIGGRVAVESADRDPVFCRCVDANLILYTPFSC